MTPERWEKIRELFHAAFGRDADERAVYLAKECAADPSRQRQLHFLVGDNETS